MAYACAEHFDFFVHFINVIKNLTNAHSYKLQQLLLQLLAAAAAAAAAALWQLMWSVEAQLSCLIAN